MEAQSGRHGNAAANCGERGDASRNRETGGAGLGLSIARDFASQYRGDVTLAESDEGGIVAALRLPAA